VLGEEFFYALGKFASGFGPLNFHGLVLPALSGSQARDVCSVMA
jgi:hypothetical protein